MPGPDRPGPRPFVLERLDSTSCLPAYVSPPGTHTVAAGRGRYPTHSCATTFSEYSKFTAVHETFAGQCRLVRSPSPPAVAGSTLKLGLQRRYNQSVHFKSPLQLCPSPFAAPTSRWIYRWTMKSPAGQKRELEPRRPVSHVAQATSVENLSAATV